MKIELVETPLKDCYIINYPNYSDDRGWFEETYSKRDFEAAGLNYDFVQDNHSYSASKGVIRGLHFQRGEFAQAKLVRCTAGRIFDVAVDLRPDSPTYKQWTRVLLSEARPSAFLIPRGFAHGFATLSNHVEFIYKCDNYYCKEAEGSIRWCDPDLNIDWGLDDNIVPILSDKDATAPFLKNLGQIF